VRRWLSEAGLEQVVVRNGWNGIEARGVRPAGPAAATSTGARKPAPQGA